MRRVVFLLCMSVSTTSWAVGGLWEGIYACDVRIPGMSTRLHISINEHTNGQGAFTIAAVDDCPAFVGYGIGELDAEQFSGTTMRDAPFSMIRDDAGFHGNIGIVFDGIGTVTAQTSCEQVW